MAHQKTLTEAIKEDHEEVGQLQFIVQTQRDVLVTADV